MKTMNMGVPFFLSFMLLLTGINSRINPDHQIFLMGEWLMKTDYESPDLIVIRADGTYSVYNEMDLVFQNDYTTVDTTAKSWFAFDYGGQTARTEIGRWSFNLSDSTLKFFERGFLKSESEFNSFYGKNRDLFFKVQVHGQNRIKLCPSNDAKRCMVYVRNPEYLKAEGQTFYTSFCKNYSGTGRVTESLSLSGYESSLLLEYTFLSNSGEIIFTDKKGRTVRTVKVSEKVEEQKIEISLRGITQLNFEVKTEGSWQAKIDIK